MNHASGAIIDQFPSYQTPQGDREILLVPAWNRLVEQLAQSIPINADSNLGIGDQSADDVAADARREALAAAVEYTRSYSDAGKLADGPLIFTGHQPELVHPGVWIKNFITAKLAEQTSGVAVNLIIDCDRCVRPSIWVPAGRPTDPRRQAVFYDEMLPPMPYEERRIADYRQWDRFSKEVAAATAACLVDPLLIDWWPETIRMRQLDDRLGHVIAKTRHRTELQWGVKSLQLPQSRLCQTRSFRRFLVETIDRRASFRTTYNRALAEYRSLHRIRNRAQPLPDLSLDGEMTETPFWIYQTEQPERRALYVARQGDRLLLSDLAAICFEVPRDANHGYEDACAVLAQQEARGVKIRSRALTTTLYVRLFLADLFIHGIGGGKYDQATDLLARQFFGVTPPRFAVASGTLKLGIDLPGSSVQSPSAIEQQLRHLHFHPETWVTRVNLAGPERTSFAEEVARKEAAIAMSAGSDHGRTRHRRIVAANRRLNGLLAPVREELEQLLLKAKRQERALAVLDSREYAFCLYSTERLRSFLRDSDYQA